MKKPNPPFTIEWTIERTFAKMQDCINFSMARTASRIPEFADDPVKSAEILQTLVTLAQAKAGLEKLKPITSNTGAENAGNSANQ